MNSAVRILLDRSAVLLGYSGVDSPGDYAFGVDADDWLRLLDCFRPSA